MPSPEPTPEPDLEPADELRLESTPEPSLDPEPYLEPCAAPSPDPDAGVEPSPVFQLLYEGDAATADPGTSVDHAVTLTDGGSLDGPRQALLPTEGDAHQALLSVEAPEGWGATILHADDMAALLDSNGDGWMESDVVPGEARALIVRVHVPEAAVAGETGTMTLSVREPESVIDDPVASAELVTIAARQSLLEVRGGPIDFGSVSPRGDLDPALAAIVEVTTDANGASYVMREAVHVLVASNAPWSVDCLLGETTSPTHGVDDGGLSWRRSGTSGWSEFGRDPIQATSCVDDQPVGSMLIAYDVRLRVEWTDPPARIEGGLAFELSEG